MVKMKAITKEELSKLTDEELLLEAKKMKSIAMLNAGLIGFAVGIIIYSILNNRIGLFTLIPLFFIYKMFNGSKNNAALKKILHERGLK